MRRYNLRHETEDRWMVVDSLTMQEASLAGIAMSGMRWPEACDMVDLMNSLDSIDRAAGRAAVQNGEYASASRPPGPPRRIVAAPAMH